MSFDTAKIDKINTGTSEGDLTQLLSDIAADATNSALKQKLKSLLGSEKIEEVCAANVLSAGLFGAIPGHQNLGPDGSRVNPFLHKLRKAMLACDGLHKLMKENAIKYAFYPEFWTENNLRRRIAAVGRAHADMGPKNDELTCLYSLGGYFDKKAAEGGVNVTKAGGTTCVMTARAIYQAAGAEMIGQKVPSVGTPMGPDAELGVPSVTQSKQTTITTKKEVFTYAPGKDDETGKPANAPALDIGDIYYLDGQDTHLYLIRGGGAFAAHVGVVVSKGASSFDTVDGGSGSGNETKLNAKRSMVFVANLGWTLTNPNKCYSQADIDELTKYMKTVDSDTYRDNYIRTNPMAGHLKKGFEKLYQQYEDTKNQMILTQLNQIRASATRLIRDAKASTLGELRMIHGWWKPERYGTLEKVSAQPSGAGAIDRIVGEVKHPDILAVKQRKAVPFEFVLDAIASRSPVTRSMFGCLAVYVEDKIVMALRDKSNEPADNGVWLATTEEHHQSLRREFPSMRSIQMFGKEVTGWQVLPVEAPDFEEAALRACELIVAGDLESARCRARDGHPVPRPRRH